jgi:segregation and condensation protein B
MNEIALRNSLEAILLAAGRPLTLAQLLELFDDRERPSDEEARSALANLASEYEGRGLELREVSSGWRVQVRQQYMDVVSRLWQERPSKYSRAFLETLALIAYRQPITRSEIEEIRGVAVASTIMRTLQERNWIRVLGHREVPGRPELLGTTREFLDYFGLKSLDELPTLAELKDVENIGVQLEFPSGEVTITTESSASPEAADAQVSESDEVEADVEDGDQDEESDGESPTMVAGSNDDESFRTLHAPSPRDRDEP